MAILTIHLSLPRIDGCKGLAIFSHLLEISPCPWGADGMIITADILPHVLLSALREFANFMCLKPPSLQTLPLSQMPRVYMHIVRRVSVLRGQNIPVAVGVALFLLSLAGVSQVASGQC